MHMKWNLLSRGHVFRMPSGADAPLAGAGAVSHVRVKQSFQQPTFQQLLTLNDCPIPFSSVVLYIK